MAGLEAIVAVYGDWGIGADGTQPVTVSADRKHFRDLTMGAAVIVGRRTLADFPGGRPLKGRTNIVLSRTAEPVEGAVMARSAAEALEKAAEYPRALCIGGASGCRALCPHFTRVNVTKLDITPHSDAFFPNLDADPAWRIAEESEEQEENGVRYRFLVYERR